MKQMTATTAGALIENLVSAILWGTLPWDKIVKNDKYIYHDVEFILSAPANDLDFSEVLWTKHRWARFFREYLSKDELDAWISSCSKGTPGISELAERGYIFQQKSASPGHKLLGNCLLGMSFRGYPYPMITMHSRSSNFFPVAYLDLSLGSLLAVEIGNRRKEFPVSLTWKITSLQIDFQWLYSYYKTTWLRYHNKSDVKDPFVKKVLSLLTLKEKAMRSGEITKFSRKREDRLFRKTIENSDPTFFPSLEEIE